MSCFDAELAWATGDRPDAPVFETPVPALVASALLAALRDVLPPRGRAEARFCALRPMHTIAGRYRLESAESAWFVRVTARRGAPELERAVTQYLAAEGISVAALQVAGVPLEWHGRPYRIDVRPMISGSHFSGQEREAVALASLLADCHAALRRFPRAAEIRARARVRYARLDETLARLARDTLRRDDFEGLIGGFTPHFDELPGAQPVHGEVHCGNVLFRDDGSPVLLDFEESVESFAPPTWDLAYLLHRFVVSDGIADARARCAPCLAAYGAHACEVAPMMRQAAWFGLAMCFDLAWREGLKSPPSEHEKFRRLAREAKALFGVI